MTSGATQGIQPVVRSVFSCATYRKQSHQRRHLIKYTIVALCKVSYRQVCLAVCSASPQIRAAPVLSLQISGITLESCFQNGMARFLIVLTWKRPAAFHQDNRISYGPGFPECAKQAGVSPCFPPARSQIQVIYGGRSASLFDIYPSSRAERRRGKPGHFIDELGP